jgi:hypothetical protein
MLRVWLLLLLAANAGFLAWTQGWLAPALPPPGLADREPQRLAAQHQPDRVQLLRPAPAEGTVATPAQDGCLQAGPFDAAAQAQVEALLAEAGLPAARWVQVPAPAGAPDPGASAPQALPAGTPRWLRVPQTDAAEQERLRALALPGPGFRPCDEAPAPGGT